MRDLAKLCRLLWMMLFDEHFSQSFISIVWWRHQMETFSALLALCEGNSPVTGEFPPHKGQECGALMLSLICAWTNYWANNGDTGDLRRHRAHNDVNEMANLKKTCNFGVSIVSANGHARWWPCLGHIFVRYLHYDSLAPEKIEWNFKK